jgi:hypothetical protein
MFRGLLLSLWIGLAACKTSAPTCQRQVADCLKRCDASGADPKPTPGNTPQNTLSSCEAKCQSCREEAAPKPAGPPTLTGNAPP